MDESVEGGDGANGKETPPLAEPSPPADTSCEVTTEEELPTSQNMQLGVAYTFSVDVSPDSGATEPGAGSEGGRDDEGSGGTEGSGRLEGNGRFDGSGGSMDSDSLVGGGRFEGSERFEGDRDLEGSGSHDSSGGFGIGGLEPSGSHEDIGRYADGGGPEDGGGHEGSGGDEVSVGKSNEDNALSAGGEDGENVEVGTAEVVKASDDAADSGENNAKEEEEEEYKEEDADGESEEGITEEEEETVEATDEEGEESVADEEEEVAVEEPIKREHNLPDKLTFFQVRVRVIKACHLPGGNIDPSFRVTIDTQKKQTKSKKSTNKPVFNETLFYNFNEKPDTMFDKIFQIQGFDTKGLLSSTFLGSFVCDVGTIYFQKEHAIVNKWVLLTAAEDTGGGRKGNDGTTHGGTPAGYVQITAAVLGPGDELPDRAKTEFAGDDTDDLETNLWMPGGVKLTPATFMLKVYRVEGLPQMDSDALDVGKLLNSSKKADRCDPYCKFSFAGRSTKTAIKLNSYNPEYNVELGIPFKFPSMCDKVQLQVYDWDRVGDDEIIGTTFFFLSQISSLGGSDFLPSFGPSFVNFYGSAREFSVVTDDYSQAMNEGLQEGMCYRGRALVEICTKLGSHAPVAKQNIKAKELIKVQPYLRRRKYKLFATFLSANAIVESSKQVQFEVSIGNYGSLLDNQGELLSSTTPPVVPKYDGTQYYYLPWNDSKPCCVVESHWEDVSFRLEPMNMLRNIAYRLEKNIDVLELAIKLNIMNKGQDTKVASLIVKIIDHFIEDCKSPLPQFNDRTAGITKLDLKLQEIRVAGLNTLAKETIAYREKATDIHDATRSLKGLLSKLKELCFEPQNSVPDVVISMLKGDKRIAHCRLPSQDILFSKNILCKGVHCAKQQSISLKVLGKKADDIAAYREVPACLDVILWLGLEEDQSNFVEGSKAEGSYSVYAETYENQIKLPMKSWSSDGCPRPAFSNSEGNIRLNKEFFQPPEGWKWDEGPDGDWNIAPDKSSSAEPDEGRFEFTEEVYEIETRNKKGVWVLGEAPYTDAENNPLEHKNDVILPDKWEWTGDWSTDCNRPCDEQGWDYKLKAKSKEWVASMKPGHKFRRRSLVRTRVKVACAKREPRIDKDSGWGYAGTFGNEYHVRPKHRDMVRRRRWVRKMVVTEIGHPPIFSIPHKDKKKPHYRIMPNMALSFEGHHKWQLRAYLYQARNVVALDDGGTSDPYAVVCFQHQTQKTRYIKKTLCPEWDQTLMFEGLQLYGSPEFFVETPPYICINLYDKDIIGKDEFCGRCLVRPIVRLNGAKNPSTRLLWYPITYNGKEQGELLAAFELFLDEGIDLPFSPPMQDNRYIVPNGIRPVIARTGVEVLCWGVRNLKKFQLAACTSPSVSIQVGGNIIQSDVIKNTKKNPNFTKNVLFQEMFLPKEPFYIPPINIVVRDHRSFGRKPIVGTHVISTVYLSEPPNGSAPSQLPVTSEKTSKKEFAIKMEEETTQKKAEAECHLDWWAKYYASIGDYKKCGTYLEDGYKTIQVYHKELEKVEEFGGLNDFVDTFPLERGQSNDDEEDGNMAGEFKGVIKIYPLPGNGSSKNRYFSKIKESKPEECIVRVYIIRAYDLTPKDDNGLADPYLVIKLGSKKITTKDRYIPNELNPLFGEYFELTCMIPIVKDLKIKVYDYDLIGRDDFIGETTIDLEDRLLTKSRATVGLPPTYYTNGSYKWRDSKKPREILESYADPVYAGDTRVVVNGTVYTLEELEDPSVTDTNLGPPDERLALHVLNSETFSWSTLVPEHIETRTLVEPLEPNMSQGRLEMFVDLFPVILGPPGPPINITPRQPRSYELRVIIWNTAKVPCIDTSITGDEMVDIFLKGWIEGQDNKAMKTDVHYHSLDGDGMFNWRMVFPFQYIPEESVMVVEQKEHFWSLDKTRTLIPPKFILQVWDHDMFSPNEYIGMLELNLNKLLLPSKKQKILKLANKPTYVDLFKTKIAKGWWTMSGENMETGIIEEKGKVEMTVEILHEEEARDKECGKGREEPNINPTLEKPDRPKNGLSFFRNPFKAIFCMIWKRYKWLIMGLFFAALFLIIIVLFGYNALQYGTKKMIGV